MAQLPCFRAAQLLLGFWGHGRALPRQPPQSLTHHRAFASSHFLHRAGSGERSLLSPFLVAAYRHSRCNLERLLYLVMHQLARNMDMIVILELDIAGVATWRLQLPRNTQVI